VGLDILKFEQTSLFYSALYFNWGSLELCFGGAKPTKAPLPRRDCVAKLQFAFQCNRLGKVLRLRDMSSLQDMSNFLFISMTAPKVVLQPLGWRCVECATHHERDVREE